MHRPVVLSVAFVLLLASLAQPQVVEYYHLDAVGNVRAVTDQNGQLIERHDYLPFGEEWNPQPSEQPLRFTGKERDRETGLDYFGARYYTAGIGRFTTVDPAYTLGQNLGDPQRWNRYAYGRNNPLRYVDSDGKVILDYREFRFNLSVAASFGEEGVGYVIPTLATLAVVGSAANDILLAIGVGEGLQAARAGLAARGLARAASAEARGGIGPVLKGQAGVERSIAAAEARGETILGREITVDTPAARTRIDLATKTPEGKLKFIECKNGPCADLTPNQRAAFPEIEAGGGIPRGARAAEAGLKPGQPLGPTQVVVERH